MDEKNKNDVGVPVAERTVGLMLQVLAEDGSGLSANIPNAIRIEPQPKWGEIPGEDGDGYWCGRYQCLVMSRSGEPDVDVDVDAVFPPSPDVMPVEIDKVWYWVPRDSDRSGTPQAGNPAEEYSGERGPHSDEASPKQP